MSDKPVICPFCHKDVFEFGNQNYTYDHDLAKTRGEVGLYVVHRDCWKKRNTDDKRDICARCGESISGSGHGCAGL